MRSRRRSLSGVHQEPQVKAVFEPMLSGQSLGDIPESDRQYLIDLGLLERRPSGGLVITNPIYQEIIPRTLANSSQDSLPDLV
ncbi:MAG: hypothetical protein F6K47_28865 [Symploca sp. SIO2E6]|nr:hypothetical protein [Symploca sp. SIO2E6]